MVESNVVQSNGILYIVTSCVLLVRHRDDKLPPAESAVLSAIPIPSQRIYEIETKQNSTKTNLIWQVMSQVSQMPRLGEMIRDSVFEFKRVPGAAYDLDLLTSWRRVLTLMMIVPYKSFHT